MMEEKIRKRKKGKAKIVFSGKTKRFICLTCPKGCALETDGTQVAGARCEKGQAFACQEWIEPLRVLTTTVRCKTERGGRIIPIKTAFPVPLSRLAAMMKALKALQLLEVPPIGTTITVPGLRKPLEVIVTGE
jgi:CxxC motif-containing protein